MALDEPNDADLTCEHEGFALVIERELIEAFGGVSVDYITDSRGVGFDIRVKSEGPEGCGPDACSSCH